jgi:hypothetical protein
MGELSERAVGVRALTLKARIRLQQRIALRMRTLANNALLLHQDGVAGMYERSAERAEAKAAQLLEELLDLTQGYLKVETEGQP